VKIPFGKKYLGKMLFGKKYSWEKCFLGSVLLGKNNFREKCILGKIFFGKNAFREKNFGKSAVGKVHSGKTRGPINRIYDTAFSIIDDFGHFCLY